MSCADSNIKKWMQVFIKNFGQLSTHFYITVEYLLCLRLNKLVCFRMSKKGCHLKRKMQGCKRAFIISFNTLCFTSHRTFDDCAGLFHEIERFLGVFHYQNDTFHCSVTQPLWTPFQSFIFRPPYVH